MQHAGKFKYSEVISRLKKALPETHFHKPKDITIGSRQYPLSSLVLGKGNSRRALISAGIHGDEPAGVETLVAFLLSGAFQKHLDQWELTIIPCINPSGIELGTRENGNSVDLNRSFRDNNPPEEILWVQSFFNSSFDLDIELHEDVDSPGYYLYQKENGPISGLGRNILDAVSKIMPLNQAEEIEELPAENGLLAKLSEPEEMEWWPMALYAYSRGCKKIFTVETSIDFPMKTRVEAHLKAIEVALKKFQS